MGNAYGVSRELIAVTIANGTSLSAEVQTGGRQIVGLIMPAAWTAAGIAFQARLTGSTFGSVQSNTAEVTATAAASQYINLAGLNLVGLGGVKVRSGTEGTPVNQGADRALWLVLI